MARELFDSTSGVRGSLIGQSENFLGGGMDVRETPSYEAYKLATDSGFNRAKDNAIARFAPGGGLIDAMTGLEGQRATTLATGAGQIYDQELQRALTLGTGLTNTGIQGIGQAAQTQAANAQASSSTAAAGKGALGSAAGGYFGSK